MPSKHREGGKTDSLIGQSLGQYEVIALVGRDGGHEAASGLVGRRGQYGHHGRGRYRPRIMSHDVQKVEQLTMGFEMGLGEIREQSIRLLGEKLDNLRVEWKLAKLKGHKEQE